MPDANGWLLRDGQWYRVESTGGSGGVGYEQLDIQSVTNDAIVADVRYFLTNDLERNINVASTSGVVTGNGDALGAYWVAPARLAALQEGYDGVTRIFRGQRQFNGQSLEVVASATFSQGTYQGFTYDLATGLLLVSGSLIAGPGVLVTDDDGNLLDSARGAVSLSHKQLVGTRQLDVPWVNSALPEWVAAGGVISYRGESRVEFDPASGIPNVPGQPVTLTHTFDRAAQPSSVSRPARLQRRRDCRRVNRPSIGSTARPSSTASGSHPKHSASSSPSRSSTRTRSRLRPWPSVESRGRPR